MKNLKTKTFVSIILSILLIIGVVPLTVIPAFAAEQSEPVMRAGSIYAAEKYAKNVLSVTFMEKSDYDELDTTNSVNTIGLSTNGNGSIMLRLMKNADNATKYDIYIGSEGMITANADSSQMFSGFTSLKTINGLDRLDTSNVTNMNNMFYACGELTTLDLSSFDTSNVTDMSGMFSCCGKLTSLNLSSFDTQKVTTMGGIDANHYSRSKGMFAYCSSLTSLNLSNFNTSEATNMSGMFTGCSSLTSLDLSNFNTSKVTDMSGMFEECSSLATLNISNFNTSNVTKMSYTNSYSPYTHGMFFGCSALQSLNLDNFDTSKVTDMTAMFANCSSLTSLDLSNFDTSNVVSMCIGGGSGRYIGMFQNCSSLTALNVSSFDTSKITNMTDMFTGCASLTELDVSNFDTSNVTSMYGMFDECCSLISLDISNFDLSNVDASRFISAHNCYNLESINLSNLDFSNVDIFSSFLNNCGAMKNIYLFDVSDYDDFHLSASYYAPYWDISVTFHTNNVNIEDFQIYQTLISEYPNSNINIVYNSPVRISTYVGVNNVALSKASPSAYASENNDVATVSSDGVVSGITEGITTITMVNNETGEVTAIPTAVYDYSLNKDIDIVVNEETKIDNSFITISGPDSNHEFKLISSNENIVSVDNTTGVVTGENVGTANIIARDTITGKKLSIPVRVNDAPVTISGNKKMYVGTSQTLACQTPEDYYDGIAYTSSDTNVATVDNNGYVYANASGTTIITVTLATGATDTFTIDVAEKISDNSNLPTPTKPKEQLGFFEMIIKMIEDFFASLFGGFNK